MEFVLDCGHGNVRYSSGAPHLGGPLAPVISVSGVRRNKGLWIFSTNEHDLLGAVRVPADRFHLADQTADLYATLFSALEEGFFIYRIWHFIPGINDITNGLENYRAFCVGRHFAFESQYGTGVASHIPAASAVGASGRDLVIWVLAGKTPCRYLENPRQVPAYQYPLDYGPRPPYFSRASIVGEGAPVFISGTSSICGHVTMEPGRVDRQTHVTVENLKIILEEAGRDFSSLGEKAAAVAYLRHGKDVPVVREILRSQWGDFVNRVTFVQSAICRAELDIEIEIQLFS